MSLVIVLIVVVAAFIAFIGSTKKVRETNQSNDFPSLSFDSQMLYRPVRSLKRSIDEVIEKSADPAVKAMGGSVRQEVQDAHDRVVRALQTRDQLRKALEGHINVEGEIERMRELHESAESTQEKLAYAKVMDAKTGEFEEYKKAKDIITKIENEIEVTKASLSELKTKLAVSNASLDATSRADDLRSSLGALETIQSSVAEAQEVLQS